MLRFMRDKKHCDSCAQLALGTRTVSRRNFRDAESLAKRCGDSVPLRCSDHLDNHDVQAVAICHDLSSGPYHGPSRLGAAILISVFRKRMGDRP